MKKSIIVLATLGLASCGKKTLFCQEKMYYHDKDIANQRTGTDTKRVEYDFTIGETAMNQDGSTIKYTKEYIEQQKAELEASGRFDCEWK
jgi:hypothetical protein